MSCIISFWRSNISVCRARASSRKAANSAYKSGRLSRRASPCLDDSGRSRGGDVRGDAYEYRWADGVQIKKPIEVSAPKYVEYLMDWIETQLDDESIFPQKLGAPFPSNFRDVKIEFTLIDKKELAPLQELIESVVPY
ncbi:hypothetical protein OROMI_020289 [Orobanche minor]